MRLSITTELDYAFQAPTDIILQIEAAAIPEQRIEHAHIDLSDVEHFARLPGHDTIGERICFQTEGRLKVRYEATVDIRRLDAEIETLAAVPPHDLPAEAVEYLFPSRYCPADEFMALVEAEFGDTAGGARIAAMRDWIADSIEYRSGSSNAGTDAMETFVSRCGVCRDFAHLLVTMARASAIPARFASVYAPNVEPQDFHAVAEVFLEGAWYPVDATGMATAQDIAKIGVGRDAADVSFLTSYGSAEMRAQEISVSAL
ncbi:transglutaminase-like domain-containing protein [Qipengyuania sp.]|uniref:transglutaminase-like domain-containing protein n=1 Tax=Qipengyuania sp. TaxID=2004515 RepID=UPI003AF881F5